MDEELSKEPITVVHEHYRDTYKYIHEREKIRERYFAYAIVAVGALFFLNAFPKELISALTELNDDRANALTEIPFDVLISISWISMFIIFHKYLQITTTIERQYSYLHSLEEKLATLCGDDGLFRREGREYLNDYPAFSSWTHRLYVFILPTLYWILSVGIILGELPNILELDISSLINLIIFSFLSISYWTRATFILKSPDNELPPERS